MTRIAKFIAQAGLCSRRQAEELIKLGKVAVNDMIINSPALNISMQDQIKVNNQLVTSLPSARLWVYYKPVGLISTHRDPQNRPTIFHQLTKLPRVISVGRLDVNSEGVLLLTNNGELARYFEHPINKIERTYKVRAYGYGREIKLKNQKLIIENICYQPKLIRLLSKKNGNAWYEVVLTEGKNREIRRIFTYFGFTVNRLIRLSYGNYQLNQLKPGQYKEVSLPLIFKNSIN